MEVYNSNMTYDNMTYDNMTYHNMTYHNMTYHNMTYHNMTYDNMTYHNMTYHNMTYHNMTYHNMTYHNMTVDHDLSSFEKLLLSSRVVNSVIVSSGLPLCAVAVCVLYSLVRRDGKPAPVFVINLLISDVLQICCLLAFIPLNPIKLGHVLWLAAVVSIYVFCLPISAAFMVCIALERYLLVVWPLWYRFKWSTRTSVVVSVLVWIFCAMVSVVGLFHGIEVISTIFNVLFLLPVPLFLFCLTATLRALSACRLPADEKRRIVAVLVLVLLIYIVVFLPVIITQLAGKRLVIYDLPFVLVRLNPLADLVLYVFMQKGAVDKLLASVCCCKVNSGDPQAPE